MHVVTEGTNELDGLYVPYDIPKIYYESEFNKLFFLLDILYIMHIVTMMKLQLPN